MVDFRAGKASPDKVVHMGRLSLNSLMFFFTSWPCRGAYYGLHLAELLYHPEASRY